MPELGLLKSVEVEEHGSIFDTSLHCQQMIRLKGVVEKNAIPD